MTGRDQDHDGRSGPAPAGERAVADPNLDAKSHSTMPLSAPPPGGMTSPAPPLAPGSVVKHYEILRELGHGGMGNVFLARDTRLARLCALKLMLEHTGSSARRFLAEAQATARCQHDSIVTIYDVDEIEGYPYMVLEYLEGRSLRAWMAARESPASPRQAVDLIVPVVRALGYAHEHGIVHRDLKPENIFVTHTGAIKVLDFGVAKRIGLDEIAGAVASADAQPSDSRLTRQGARIGTLPYMSPEQWRGMDITPQADLWAIGIILFELVTGSHPLAPANTSRLLEVQDLDRSMPSVCERLVGVGPLGAVIDRCLHKRRAERIGSARELLAALEPLVSASTVAAPHRRHRFVALLAACGTAVAAFVVLGIAGTPGVDWARHATATGTAITDVPLPPSSRAEAQAAYAAALHAFRDASWAIAEDHLRRAIALDPALAAAHLRLALLLNYTAGRVPEAHQSYALAVQWRTALSVRDRDILAAFDPVFAHDPPDLTRFTAELADLARRHRSDAEVFGLVALFSTEGAEHQLRAAQRAVEIDPAYADAWQAAGKQLFALGRIPASLRAFDTCLVVSPAAVDCLGERAQVHAAQGDCAAAEADLRNAAAMNPQGRYWRDLWASSLMALGKPVEAAIEVLRQKWAAQPEARRALVELDDRARLDLLRGRFDDAQAGALALQARTREQPDADLHGRYAGLLIDLALERDRPGDAAETANDYLRRRDAWVSAGSILDEIEMLAILHQTGRLSSAEFDARRASWLLGHGDLGAGVRDQIWLAAWARPATTPDAARAALAIAPTSDLRALAHRLIDHAVLGALLLRAGRTTEAIPFLERAAHGCDGFLAPIEHLRAAARLGHALEAAGDRGAACAAYQRVLSRWREPSVTARDALTRAVALGCAGAQ